VIKTIAENLHLSVSITILSSLVACKSSAEQQLPELSRTSNGQTIETELPKVTTPMNLKNQIEFSINDLARRLDVPRDSVVLSSANQVTWRSGALGCPEPGMIYTEALVPGSVIYLQVDNAIHAYHAKFAGAPFYCPRERVEPPVQGDENDPT
jgi:hypothetical protein